MPRLWLSKEFRRKLLMSINLIMIIMTSCLQQVSASGFAQKFSFKKRNASLQEVFKEIKTQTGYNVLYYPEKIDAGKSIHVNFNNTDLKVVLEQLSADLKFSYSIDEKNILIKPAQQRMLDQMADMVVAAFRQDSVVFKGRVLDVFGQPLPGASIKVKGTKKSTFTTKEGNFAIFAASNAILQVSFIG